MDKGENHMLEAIEDEFQQFVKDVNRGETFMYYVDEDEYEDEYSHNDIEYYQGLFADKVREYLKKHYPDKFIVSPGFRVFIMTKSEAEKRNMHHWEHLIVK